MMLGGMGKETAGGRRAQPKSGPTPGFGAETLMGLWDHGRGRVGMRKGRGAVMFMEPSGSYGKTVQPCYQHASCPVRMESRRSGQA